MCPADNSFLIRSLSSLFKFGCNSFMPPFYQVSYLLSVLDRTLGRYHLSRQGRSLLSSLDRYHRQGGFRMNLRQFRNSGDTSGKPTKLTFRRFKYDDVRFAHGNTFFNAIYIVEVDKNCFAELLCKILTNVVF